MVRLLLAWLSMALATASAPAAERPHVVIFLADDLSRSDCAPFGGREVPMPNLTALAKEGLTFTHAFVASPSCAPSRAALLTGLDPMKNGAMLNHARPRAELKTWPAYFKELGYECVAIGKVAHYAQVTQYGFDHVSHFKYHDDECVNEAVSWLAGRTSRKPLCLFVGTNWPHVPWPAESTIRPTGLPPKLVDTPETYSARGRYLAAVANCDRDLGLVRSAAKKHLGDNVLFAFTSDHGSQFPFGKWNGYDEGVRTPLVVAWPGRVAAGTSTDAMVSWVDLLPTTLAACGGSPPLALSGQSFLDVLTGKANSHRDKVFVTHSGDGRMNRYPLRAVRTPGWKYIRNLDPAAEHHTHVNKGNAGTDGRNYWDSWEAKAKSDPAAAALVKRYHSRPAEELYDVIADPWETKNLAGDPALVTRLNALRKDLDAWMAANGDEGLKTERGLPDPQPNKKK